MANAAVSRCPLNVDQSRFEVAAADRWHFEAGLWAVDSINPNSWQRALVHLRESGADIVCVQEARKFGKSLAKKTKAKLKGLAKGWGLGKKKANKIGKAVKKASRKLVKPNFRWGKKKGGKGKKLRGAKKKVARAFKRIGVAKSKVKKLLKVQ